MKILIIKNKTHEGPGLILEVLKENKIDYEIVDLDNNEEFSDPKNYSALIVLGGPDSANDKTEKMQNELKRIKEAVDAQIPYFGVCLGMQTLVKANGGEVLKNKIKEIGFKDPGGKYFEINLTEEGKKDPLFNSLNSNITLFHLHGETVILKENMELLASGKHCKNQVVKVGDNAYGFQGHFELTKEMFNDWINKDPDLQELDSASLRNDYEKIKKEHELTGKQIMTNFLRIAKVID